MTLEEYLYNELTDGGLLSPSEALASLHPPSPLPQGVPLEAFCQAISLALGVGLDEVVNAYEDMIDELFEDQ